MRITNGMIANRVTFNLNRSLNRFMKAQTDVSTGRRINTASDDPIGVVRDLDFRREISKIVQYQKNISRATSFAVTYDNSLADIGAALSSANEIVVAMANGVFDADQRNASATEIESIMNQIMLLANGSFEGRQLFGGLRTQTTSFERGANGVVYRGDQGTIDFEIETGRRNTVNLVGSDVFLKQLSILGEDSDLNNSVTGATLLANLKNGAGIDQAVGTFQITDKVNNFVSTIDVSAATTLSDVISTINAQLFADGIKNVVAELGLENNNILLNTTNLGNITNDTLLTALRNGDGIDQTPGIFQITDGAGINITVDISGDQTIADVITTTNVAIAAAGVSNFVMGFNPGFTGLTFTDTNIPPRNLSVLETSPTSSTAQDLGILGSFQGSLIGEDLNPELRLEVTELTGTTASDLGILKEITGDYSGNDLDPVLIPSTLISELNLSAGYNLGEIKITQGERIVTLNLGSPTIVTVQDMIDAINNTGLNITASINSSNRGVQIVNNDVSRTLAIEDIGNGRTTKDLKIYGSSDLLGSMQVILNALRADDQEGVGLLKENIEDSIRQILDQRAIVGSRAKTLETTSNRLIDSELRFTVLLSEVEDADLTEVVTQLAAKETSYQAALLATSRIIQPSLLDFLR